ncbi:FtsX-like permease family protein [Corynebacterium sp. CNCTC7651]|uniref:FtsX-like permease family protein n=1 Tax=Corynebacterium sp. CNCTC7651 TaxID=2815361 RepID=UPI001F262E78|nr:FtsX-like permease family protein [Corynebacterium sp. CNCTC7651]UIZ91635.1 FtsX-like permease family protein [Corynebacterium sp. CNCTC7651]
MHPAGGRLRNTTRLSPATVIAVLLATALVSFTFLIQHGIRAEMERAVRTSIGDASVVVTSASSEVGLRPSLAEGIRGLPGVRGVTEQAAGIAVTRTEPPTAVGVQVLIDASLLTITDGHLPAGESEALLVEVPGKPTRYPVGAQIEVEGYGGEAEHVTIAGIATAALGATEEPSLPTLLSDLPTAQRLLGVEGSTTLLVAAEGDAGEVFAAVDELVAASGAGASVMASEAYVAANASNYAVGTRTIALALKLLSAVSLLAAFVVIGNNYQLQLARSTREIALLRSIGALRRQVFWLLTSNALRAGVIGALGGIALGVLAGAAVLRGLPAGAARPGFWAGLVAVGLAAGVVPSVLAALRPAYAATRVSPLQALRAADVEATGSAAGSVFTFVAKQMARVSGPEGRQAVAQLARHPGRSGATAAAVWIGATLTAALLVGGASAQATLSEAVEGATPTDVVVTPNGDAGALAATIAELPEVEAAAAVTDLVLDASFADTEGPMTVAAWNPQLGGVLRTDTAIAEPTPGTIILPPTPQTAGRAASTSVALHQPGVTRVFSIQVVEGAPLMGVLNRSDIALFDAPSQSVWVKLAPGVSPSVGMDALARVPGIAALSSPALQREGTNEELQGYVRIGVAFLLVSLLIALVGLANNVALAVVERRREIGLLRALGATKVQVMRGILAETQLLAASGAAIGLACGIVAGAAGSRALLGGEQLHVVVQIPWARLALLLIGLLAAAGAAAIVPARRAAAIPPIAALRSA